LIGEDFVMPKRIQRKRTKGWRMPPNTVSVTRPGPFGNHVSCCVSDTCALQHLRTHYPIVDDLPFALTTIPAARIRETFNLAATREPVPVMRAPIAVPGNDALHDVAAEAALNHQRDGTAISSQITVGNFEAVAAELRD
jgi:hypothetical protein